MVSRLGLPTDMDYMGYADAEFSGVPVRVCRTGYTGEHGYELLRDKAQNDLEAAERELRAEVLDQDLRASIARETEPVRNAILALAFSRTGLQESE